MKQLIGNPCRHLAAALAHAAGLMTPSLLMAGDFSPFREQMSSIAEVIIKVHFIERGRCESIRKCQLDGFVKYASSRMYIYGVSDVGDAISIVEVALRQQSVEKLPVYEIEVYKETARELARKRGSSPTKVMKVTSIIG